MFNFVEDPSFASFCRRHKFYNCADGTTPHSNGNSTDEVLTDNEHDGSIFLVWFFENFVYADEYRLLVSRHRQENTFASSSDETI